MRLTVFGASGGTGRRLVEQALAAGHDVTAVVRDPARLVLAGQPALVPDAGARGRLLVRTADVFDQGQVEGALAEADAVVSALGARSRSDTSKVMSAGSGTILDAMRRAGLARVVVVSAAPVAGDDAGTTLLYRLVAAPLLRAVLRDAYADMAAMEAAVRTSGLDWTIMRPPQLTNGAHTGSYRQAREANLRGGYRISRADLADAILASLADPTTIGTTIALGY
jgi:putative NADH-flavin reductase